MYMYVLCLRNKALEGCGLEPQYSTQLHLVLYWASQPRPPCAIFPAQHFKACYNYMYYTCTCMLYSLRGSKASVATMQMSAKHRDKSTCVHVHVNGLARKKATQPTIFFYVQCRSLTVSCHPACCLCSPASPSFGVYQ